MPLVLRHLTTADTFAWTRIRTLAYLGPLHTLTHTQPLSNSSILALAHDRSREIGKTTQLALESRRHRSPALRGRPRR
ncbi:hypothetical protein PMIN06_000380 [Paraphaeosphaeria minitans]